MRKPVNTWKMSSVSRYPWPFTLDEIKSLSRLISADLTDPAPRLTGLPYRPDILKQLEYQYTVGQPADQVVVTENPHRKERGVTRIQRATVFYRQEVLWENQPPYDRIYDDLRKAYDDAHKFYEKQLKTFAVPPYDFSSPVAPPLLEEYRPYLPEDYLQEVRNWIASLEQKINPDELFIWTKTRKTGPKVGAYRILFVELASVMDLYCPHKENHLTKPHRLPFLKETIRLVTGKSRSEEMIRDDYDDLFDESRVPKGIGGIVSDEN